MSPTVPTGEKNHSGKNEYEVLLDPAAIRDLDKLNPGDSKRVDERIRSLRVDPRPSGTVKLKNNIYRIRVGPWRIIYIVEDNDRRVLISRVKRREKDTYKGL